MAFSIKQWKDRISEYANRRKLVDSSSGTEQIVTVARYEGNITQEGDAFSAENMNDLESRINSAFNDVTDETSTAISTLRGSLATVATSGSYTDLSDKPTIPAAVSVKGSAETNYRTGQVNLTAANVGAATSNHVHGNIANNGTLSANVAIANGDRLLIRDVSDSNKITSSNTAFGTSTTTYLRNDGAWGTPPNTITAPYQIRDVSVYGNGTYGGDNNTRTATCPTVANYTPVGVVGFEPMGTYSAVTNMCKLTLAGTTLSYTWTGMEVSSSQGVKAKVLYLKTS